MTSVQDRLKIRRENVDTWSTREQLCLASSVMKSGDQNWISVSRSLKPLAEKEALRPSDWFSQKSCAIQYALLLENADTPKRKKRESGETTGESIVKRLTQERIAELGQILAFQRDEYQQLKADLSLLKSGPINDEKLQKMWLAIEQEEREQEQKTKAHSLWLAKRQHKQEALSQSTTVSTPKKAIDSNSESHETVETIIETDDDKTTQRGQSTLLTTLLKSISPTTQIPNTSTAQVTSPTIASLLGSNSKIITTSQTTTNITPQLHQLVSCAMSTGTSERPSTGAPTLSMLLALPANLSKGILPNLPNSTPQNSSVDSATARPVKQVNQNCSTVQNTATTSEIPEAESMVQIIDHIDGVIGKDKIADVIDKDEINEIIGDIEELIKEEITRSPQTTEPTPVVIESLPLLPEKPIQHEQPAESRNIKEPVSLSNSPESEMAIEEIDQSTSNIAEIIGTAIEPTESKPDEPTNTEAEVHAEEKPETEQSMEIEIKNEEKNVTPIESAIDSTDVKVVDEKTEEKVVSSEDVKEVNEVEVKDVEIQENKVEADVQEKEEEKEEAEEEKVQEKVEKEEEKEKKVIEKQDEIIVVENDSESQDMSLKLEEPDEKKEIEEVSTNLNKEEIVKNKVELEEKIEADKECVTEPKEVKDEEKEESIIKKVEETVEQAVENETIPETVETSETLEPKEDAQDISETASEAIENVTEENKVTPEIVEEKIEVSKDEITELEKSVEIIKDEDSKNEETSSVPIVSEEIKEVPVEKIEDVSEAKIEVETNDKEDETKIEEETSSKEEIVEEKPSKAEEIKEEEKEVEEEKVSKEMEVEEKVEDTEKKVETEEAEVKKEEINVTEDADIEEEESSLTKLSGRAMKTYSKKQNVTADSEPETESSEGADYRAWKKAVMVVYNRLATHKYASVFLRPITEDQAPGYHSVIFRPMDLSTIKKNIDNGTIRSTMHFQRDVMLMFQNAIMYNKHDTFVYKMAMSMQEECLQHMQILVQVTGEGPFRRETRTAASSSSSSDLSENSTVKRKRSLITPSPLDSESPRMKKRRKSEND